MEHLFKKLDTDKQKRIINASLQVFSVNDFKHALTDDIAAKAQISKGSLFQYFKNKISLYIYLYNFSLEQLGNIINGQFNFKERDYFELQYQSLLLKITLYKEHPYLNQFVIKANEEINPEIAYKIAEINQGTKRNYLRKIYNDVDYNKFTEGIDIKNLSKMINWCSEGIWKEGLNNHSSVDNMYQETIKMLDFYKKAVYKQVYLK